MTILNHSRCVCSPFFFKIQRFAIFAGSQPLDFEGFLLFQGHHLQEKNIFPNSWSLVHRRSFLLLTYFHMFWFCRTVFCTLHHVHDICWIHVPRVHYRYISQVVEYEAERQDDVAGSLPQSSHCCLFRYYVLIIMVPCVAMLLLVFMFLLQYYNVRIAIELVVFSEEICL